MNMKTFSAAVLAVTLLVSPATASVASTISVHEVKAGQFCKKADLGKKKVADNGAKVKCKMDGSRARWKKY